MHYNKTLISCAVGMALVLGAGCSKSPQEAAQAPAQAEAPVVTAAPEVTTAPAAAASEVSAAKMIPLPFDEIVGDYDFQEPPALKQEGHGSSDTMFYHEVIHPTGQVRSLTINGKEVAIKNPVLTDGLIETQDFGPIEFRLLGVMNNQTIVQVLASQESVAKMQTVVPQNKAHP